MAVRILEDNAYLDYAVSKFLVRGALRVLTNPDSSKNSFQKDFLEEILDLVPLEKGIVLAKYFKENFGLDEDVREHGYSSTMAFELKRLAARQTRSTISKRVERILGDIEISKPIGYTNFEQKLEQIRESIDLSEGEAEFLTLCFVSRWARDERRGVDFIRMFGGAQLVSSLPEMRGVSKEEARGIIRQGSKLNATGLIRRG